MGVSSLGYSSPLWVSWFQNVNFFVLLRVEMLFLHYANELLKFLLMRCSFVPLFLSHYREDLLSQLISGHSVFNLLDLNAVFLWSPFEISVFSRFLNWNFWITRGFKISPLGDYNLFQTLFLQGDGIVGKTSGDYCFLYNCLRAVISVISYFAWMFWFMNYYFVSLSLLISF